MDKITNVTLLPQDQLNKQRKEAGRIGEEELMITDSTIYTSDPDGLGNLIRAFVGDRGDDNVTVEIGDSDVTVPLIRGANIVVTRKVVPDRDAVSPALSDHTDWEAAGGDHGGPGEEYRIAPQNPGDISKQRNLITGFHPLTRGGESWEMREIGFKPYQTSTERKINGIRSRVQAETEPDHSSGSEYTEDEEIPHRNRVNYRKYRSQSHERRSSSHKRENNTLGGRTFLTLVMCLTCEIRN